MPKSLADLVAEALSVVTEMTPEEACRILGTADREGWSFIDVREADEFDAGHLPGARHQPRGFLEVRADLDHPKRDPFYGNQAIDTTRRALAIGGLFAIWSEAPDEGFEKRVKGIGFKLESRRPGKGGLRHAVYLARRKR